MWNNIFLFYRRVNLLLDFLDFFDFLDLPPTGVRPFVGERGSAFGSGVRLFVGERGSAFGSGVRPFAGERGSLMDEEVFESLRGAGLFFTVFFDGII